MTTRKNTLGTHTRQWERGGMNMLTESIGFCLPLPLNVYRKTFFFINVILTHLNGPTFLNGPLNREILVVIYQGHYYW